MSMNREAYELANRIKTESAAEHDNLTEGPDDMILKRYEQTVLRKIKQEKQQKKKGLRGGFAAACAALFLAGMVFFGDEVHAMIKQVSWNIGKALDISGDLSEYSEVVNTTIEDTDYIVTLQEAMAAEEKLVISYTIERKDGESPDEIMDPGGSLNLEENVYPGSNGLYINGKQIPSAVMGSYCQYIDEGKTVIGAVMQFNLPGVDLSQENEYEIGFYRNRWNIAFKMGKFVFKADGSDLIADTLRKTIDREFTLPDGVTVRLKEFTSNELEQRISYEISGDSDYTLVLNAVDEEGRETEFGTRIQGKDYSYMQNEAYKEAGRLEAENQSVTMTLYARKMVWDDKAVDSNFVQVGESFTIEF